MKSSIVIGTIAVAVTSIATTIYAVPETRGLMGDLSNSLNGSEVVAWPATRPTISPGEFLFDNDAKKIGAIRAVTKKDGVPSRVWVGDHVIEGDQVRFVDNQLVVNISTASLSKSDA